MQIQKAIFGNDFSTGYDTTSEACRHALQTVKDSKAARGVAFFSLRSVRQLLLDYSCFADDERIAAIEEWARHNSQLFETIARSDRKERERMANAEVDFARKTLKSYSKWREAYNETEFWANQKSKAKLQHGKNCICCVALMDDWHHVTYERIGTDAEYLDLRPVCLDCHVGIHAGHKSRGNALKAPGPPPAIIRQILVDEEITF